MPPVEQRIPITDLICQRFGTELQQSAAAGRFLSSILQGKFDGKIKLGRPVKDSDCTVYINYSPVHEKEYGVYSLTITGWLASYKALPPAIQKKDAIDAQLPGPHGEAIRRRMSKIYISDPPPSTHEVLQDLRIEPQSFDDWFVKTFPTPSEAQSTPIDNNDGARAEPKPASPLQNDLQRVLDTHFPSRTTNLKSGRLVHEVFNKLDPSIKRNLHRSIRGHKGACAQRIAVHFKDGLNERTIQNALIGIEKIVKS